MFVSQSVRPGSQTSQDKRGVSVRQQNPLVSHFGHGSPNPATYLPPTYLPTLRVPVWQTTSRGLPACDPPSWNGRGAEKSQRPQISSPKIPHGTLPTYLPNLSR